ncbi:SGNH/GDSL hydrolase family protein [Kitasatospora gansuensis]
MKRLLAASLTALVGVSAALTGATGASAAVPAPPQTLRVLTLGDSITEGAGSRTGVGYRLPLAQLAAGQARYGVDFVGSRQIGAMADPDTEGHSGYMIDDIRSGVDGWLATARPDVVLLHIGINDLNRGVDREHAKDRLAALVDRIFADRPGVTVVLQGLIPTTVNDTGLIPLYNEAAEQLARDRRAEGKKLGYVAAPELPMAELPDGLHPNDAGYAKLARNFYDRLDQAFTDGWTARPAAPGRGPSPVRTAGCGGRTGTVTAAPTTSSSTTTARCRRS